MRSYQSRNLSSRKFSLVLESFLQFLRFNNVNEEAVGTQVVICSNTSIHTSLSNNATANASSISDLTIKQCKTLWYNSGSKVNGRKGGLI